MRPLFAPAIAFAILWLPSTWVDRLSQLTSDKVSDAQVAHVATVLAGVAVCAFGVGAAILFDSIRRPAPYAARVVGWTGYMLLLCLYSLAEWYGAAASMGGDLTYRIGMATPCYPYGVALWPWVGFASGGALAYIVSLLDARTQRCSGDIS